MEIALEYRAGVRNLRFPEFAGAHVLWPGRVTSVLGGDVLVDASLSDPIQSPTPDTLLHPGQRADIVTSDLTRSCPSALLCPPLLNAVNRAGIPDTDIHVEGGGPAGRESLLASLLSALDSRSVRENFLLRTPDACVR